MELIIRGLNILTLNPEQPRASYIHIKDGRIANVGNEEIAKNLIKAEVIDCGNSTVLPGFIDCHCHPFAIISQQLSVDCSPTRAQSISDICNLIAGRASNTPVNQWIKATGYNEFYLRESRHPDRYDLDRATMNHPVKLLHRTGHACVLNTAALGIAGISRETPDPPGGLIERGNDGEPTGLLFEMNSCVDQFIPPEREDDFYHAAKLLDTQLLSNGITTLHDAGAQNNIEQFRKWSELKNRGIIQSRVRYMVGVEHLNELFNGEYEAYLGKGNLDIGAVKIVLDTTTGEIYPPESVLREYINKLQERDIQVAIHAIEEDAIEVASRVISEATNKLNIHEQRNRIEHCSVCPPHLIESIKRSGAVIVTQPSFIYYNGERYLATVPENQQKYLYVIGSLIRNGIMVGGGSDAPVVPISPLMGIYAAVSRGTDKGQVLLPEEKITALHAIELYTTAAAYIGFEEKIKGRISVGKAADLVVLNANPLEVTTEGLKDLKVVMTIIEGKVVWQS